MPLELPGFLTARRYSTYSLNQRRAFPCEKEGAERKHKGSQPRKDIGGQDVLSRLVLPPGQGGVGSPLPDAFLASGDWVSGSIAVGTSAVSLKSGERRPIPASPPSPWPLGPTPT